MTRQTLACVVLLVALGLAVLGGCAGAPPERWEERGFDSEADCWLNHGWDGSIRDGLDRGGMFDFWCGPIEDD